MPLMAPNETLRYKDWIIPANVSLSFSTPKDPQQNLTGTIQTPVGESVMKMLTDPVRFPEPHSFKPERWLSEKDNLVEADRTFVVFGRGARGCLGMQYVISIDTSLSRGLTDSQLGICTIVPDDRHVISTL